MAVTIYSAGHPDIWVYDLSRGTLTRLTTEESREAWPVWNPGGKYVAFTSNRSGVYEIYRMRWDGSVPAERLVSTSGSPASWTPDAKVMAFVKQNDIWILPEGGEPESFIASSFNEGWPEFSPDGRWLAYASRETGRYEVYVRPYPGPGPRVPISSEGGFSPMWAGNGKELYYRSYPVSGQGSSQPVKEMMVVDITTDPEFRAGKPRVLFRNSNISSVALRSYDVTPDGKKFLMLQRESPPLEDVTELHVVLNWFEELKRRIPTDN